MADIEYVWVVVDGVVQGVSCLKKLTFCISLICNEPRNNFQNCLFLPKTDIHMYTEPSLRNIRELSYLQNLVLYEVGYPP